MVTTVQTITYRTEDGRSFDSYDLAHHHEQQLELMKIFRESRRFPNQVTIQDITDIVLDNAYDIAQILGINIDR